MISTDIDVKEFQTYIDNIKVERKRIENEEKKKSELKVKSKTNMMRAMQRFMKSPSQAS